MSKRDGREPAAYHHGDLRRALIEAAMRIVQKDGADNISLRAVARDAGVSTAAPYHHFSDKHELLCAVAEMGLHQFNAILAETGGKAPTALDRLHSLGVGYVMFLVKNPNLFALIQRPEFWKAAKPEGLVRERSENFQHLYNAVAACLPQANDHERRTACAAAWALVHGVAVLALDQRLDMVLPSNNLEVTTGNIIRGLNIEGMIKGIGQ